MKSTVWGGLLAFLSALHFACSASFRAPASAPAVAFRYQSVDGSIDTVGKHRGKVVLVSVFATWAEPALLEVPLFHRLLAEFGPDKFAIIQIAIDQEPTAVEVYSDTFNIQYFLGWPFDFGDFTGPEGPLGKVSVLPTSILLDREGRVFRRLEGTWDPKILEDSIRSLLAADRSNH